VVAWNRVFWGEALKVIDTGADLARWQVGSQDCKKREAVLNKLRSRLLSPQPPEKRIAKRFRGSNEWQVGDLVAYQLLSGLLVILRVIGHHTDRGGRSPVREFLDWVGTEVPDNRRLRSLSILKSNDVPSVSQFVIGRTSAKERPDKRLHHLGTNLNPE
jgi:hypothetical protein